jgi:hypothetical protein
MILRDAVNRLDTGTPWMAYPEKPYAFVRYENAGCRVDDDRENCPIEARLIGERILRSALTSPIHRCCCGAPTL